MRQKELRHIVLGVKIFQTLAIQQFLQLILSCDMTTTHYTIKDNNISNTHSFYHLMEIHIVNVVLETRL